MITNMHKSILCIILLNYASTNSAVSALENRVAQFTGGYEYYENIGYYKLYSLPTTWVNAWKQCGEDGGHLLVIDSEEEHEVVWKMVQRSNADAFIGVHDLFSEGTFFTVTGKLLVPSSYNKWYENEPNNYNDQDCVLLEKNGEIWDGKCDEHFNFICEYQKNETPTKLYGIF